MKELQIGDVVKLPSEDQKMTVEYLNIQEDGRCQCTWIDNGKKYFALFEPNTLIKIEHE